MEHTPGDWKVLKVHDGEYQITAPGQGKYEGESSAIARLCSWDREPPIEQLEGNAHLFAAAPDLLAACEAVVAHRNAIAKQYGYETGDYYEGYGEVMSMIESAITKARGVKV